MATCSFASPYIVSGIHRNIFSNPAVIVHEGFVGVSFDQFSSRFLTELAYKGMIGIGGPRNVQLAAGRVEVGCFAPLYVT